MFHLVGDQPKMMHRAGMSRLASKDTPIQLLRFIQAAGRMVLRGQNEGLLDRKLFHAAA